jgi:hypothetical protein
MDFATLLIIISVGVVVVAVVVPTVHRWAGGFSPRPARPELPGWRDQTRPARCPACGGADLVPVRGVQVSRENRSPLELELLVCATCGRTEWFAATPRMLEAREKPPALPAKPYRD